MKIVIAKSDLVNIIGKIQSIVPAKPSSPILTHVLVEGLLWPFSCHRNRFIRNHPMLCSRNDY